MNQLEKKAKDVLSTAEPNKYICEHIRELEGYNICSTIKPGKIESLDEAVTNLCPSYKFHGTLVAVKINGKVQIGWSRLNKNDTFNKKMGRLIAIARCESGDLTNIPKKLIKHLSQFKERASRYFKVPV